MKELVDLHKLWVWACEKWKTSFGAILACLLAFWFGMSLQGKMIVDDCKVMGAFRDGVQSFNCGIRMRNG
jgi:hypothetical protein